MIKFNNFIIFFYNIFYFFKNFNIFLKFIFYKNKNFMNIFNDHQNIYKNDFNYTINKNKLNSNIINYKKKNKSKTKYK